MRSREVGRKIEFDIIDRDHYWRMVAVRFLPGLMILVLGFYGVSAFGEEISTGRPPRSGERRAGNDGHWRRDEDGDRKFVPAFTARLEINSAGPRALLPVPVIVKETIPVPGLHYEPIVP